MKALYPLSPLYLLTFILLFGNLNTTCAQQDYAGCWEGMFMNDFKIILEFKTEGEGSGSLKMYAGPEVLQDDKLSGILQTDTDFTFYIPDKQTRFEGRFLKNATELTGVLIFPDGTEHPLTVKKMKTEDPFEAYLSVKQKKYTVEELQADLTFLRQQLEKHHPAMYAFTPKETFDVLMDDLTASIQPGMTVGSFYLLAATLTDAVKCSHTGVRLPVSYFQGIERFEKFFPFRLYFAGEKAFVVSGKEDQTLPIHPGEEIIRVNGRPVEDLTVRTGWFIPSEGCNKTTKIHGLNREFPRMYHYLFDGNEFSLTVYSEGLEKTIEIPGINYDAYRKNYDSSEPPREYDFGLVDDAQTAVLTVRTFGIRDMDDYFNFLDSVFVSLNGSNVRNLILDLRDNSGGHPIFAAQLLSYLIDEDFVYFKRNAMATDLEPLYNRMQPNPENYRGALYVLVNGGCLSTTGHLISLLKYHTKAVFVGEEPGSTYRCNDFSLQTTLPNTGIEVNIPQTTFETAVEGFEPCVPFPLDLRIMITVDDVLAGKDAYLEAILERIKEGR